MTDWTGVVSYAGGEARKQAMLRAVFESANHLITVTDPDGVIVDMNPAAERALGWRRAEVVGRMTPEVFHDPEEVIEKASAVSERLGRPIAPGFEALVAEALANQLCEYECTHIRKDGSRFPVLLSVSALRNEAGELMGFVGISTDITERKEREAAIQAAEREAEARRVAERANKAKSRFLAAASHDLRQPLQAVRLLLEALRPRLQGGEAEILDRMDEALTAGEKLLRRLLDLSLIEAGTIRPQVRAFDLAALLEVVADEFRPQAGRKALRFVVRPRRLRVLSDEVLLRRILRNLVTNALDYTSAGGVLVGVRLRGRMGWIEIWDTGIGIPEDDLDAIFECFYQVGNHERSSEQGYGLGLAIVRRTAELLGHPLMVRSRQGRGSVFAVGVPIAGEGLPKTL